LYASHQRADRSSPLRERWRGPRVVPQIETARGPASRQGILIHGGRGRPRARRQSQPGEYERGTVTPMRDFWIACGYHLLDRDASGGLVVTDEFLKAYFVRPELMPPDDACEVERRLHRELLADPRQAVAAAEVGAIADADARQNWQFVLAFRDLLLRQPTLE